MTADAAGQQAAEATFGVLANLKGRGTLADLHVAMTEDPALLSAVQTVMPTLTLANPFGADPSRRGRHAARAARVSACAKHSEVPARNSFVRIYSCGRGGEWPNENKTRIRPSADSADYRTRCRCGRRGVAISPKWLTAISLRPFSPISFFNNY